MNLFGSSLSLVCWWFVNVCQCFLCHASCRVESGDAGGASARTEEILDEDLLRGHARPAAAAAVAAVIVACAVAEAPVIVSSSSSSPAIECIFVVHARWCHTSAPSSRARATTTSSPSLALALALT